MTSASRRRSRPVRSAIRLVEQLGSCTLEGSSPEARFEVALPERTGIESALADQLLVPARVLMPPGRDGDG